LTAGPHAFGTRVFTTGTPEAVYRLLAEATSWKDWAGPLITRAQWEVEPDDSGAGGIRRLGRPPFMVREEITAAHPPHHHGYRLLSGQPVRSYRAEVQISRVAGFRADAGPSSPGAAADADPGTLIEWRGAAVPLVPGTGPLVRLLLGRMVHGFAMRLAAAAQPPESPSARVARQGR